MNKPAAISATFSDWRTVKGRKQLQLIFEVPLEQQTEVLGYLGAPVPDDPRWVAIALLKTGPDLHAPSPEGVTGTPVAGGQAAAGKPKTEGERALIRCILLCKEDGFQRWVMRHPLYESFYCPTLEDTAAAFVRARCGITTRSQIASNDAIMRRWLQLETSYLRDTGQLAEQRG